MMVCYYTCRYGAIAQLGERLHGMQEVASSNLVGSTVVSYAEFNTYKYLPCGSAAVTLIKKAVVLLFLKGDDREKYR